MTGCWVAWKCLVACLLGESSQQPTWPQLRQIRRCSHSLPLFRHSSQPSALGVTLRMPAMWLQPLATVGSDVPGVEEHEIGAAGCKLWQVGRGGLALGAAERALDRSHVVKRQYCDQINVRWPGRRRNGALADLIFSKARHFLRERDVSLGIISVESSRIFGRLVLHEDFDHAFSPFVES